MNDPRKAGNAGRRDRREVPGRVGAGAAEKPPSAAHKPRTPMFPAPPTLGAEDDPLAVLRSYLRSLGYHEAARWLSLSKRDAKCALAFWRDYPLVICDVM